MNQSRSSRATPQWKNNSRASVIAIVRYAVKQYLPMEWKKPLLVELATKGKPLADFTIVPTPGTDINDLLDRMNELAADIKVIPSPYNDLETAVGPLLCGTATRESLDREFGWVIRRANFPKWDADVGQYDGYHEDAYWWEDVCMPTRYPPSIDGLVAEMGLSQPGADDDGQDDTITYVLPN